MHPFRDHLDRWWDSPLDGLLLVTIYMAAAIALGRLLRWGRRSSSRLRRDDRGMVSLEMAIWIGLTSIVAAGAFMFADGLAEWLFALGQDYQGRADAVRAGGTS